MTKLRGLLRDLGAKEVARRVGRTEATVRRWRGRPPKSASADVERAIANRERAQRAAKTAVKRKAERAEQAERERLERVARGFAEAGRLLRERSEAERAKAADMREAAIAAMSAYLRSRDDQDYDVYRMIKRKLFEQFGVKGAAGAKVPAALSRTLLNILQSSGWDTDSERVRRMVRWS